MAIKICFNCKKRVAPWYRATCDYCNNLPFYPEAAKKYEETFRKKVKEGIFSEKFIEDEVKEKKTTVKVSAAHRNKDNSKQVSIVMMILFGAIGAGTGGFMGLIVGAIFGFAITAIFYAAQESFKK